MKGGAGNLRQRSVAGDGVGRDGAVEEVHGVEKVLRCAQGEKYWCKSSVEGRAGDWRQHAGGWVHGECGDFVGQVQGDEHERAQCSVEDDSVRAGEGAGRETSRDCGEDAGYGVDLESRDRSVRVDEVGGVEKVIDGCRVRLAERGLSEEAAGERGAGNWGQRTVGSDREARSAGKARGIEICACNQPQRKEERGASGKRRTGNGGEGAGSLVDGEGINRAVLSVGDVEKLILRGSDSGTHRRARDRGGRAERSGFAIDSEGENLSRIAIAGRVKELWTWNDGAVGVRRGASGNNLAAATPGQEQ